MLAQLTDADAPPTWKEYAACAAFVGPCLYDLLTHTHAGNHDMVVALLIVVGLGIPFGRRIVPVIRALTQFVQAVRGSSKTERESGVSADV